MRDTPISQNLSAAPHKDRRGRRRTVPWCRDPVLGPRYRQLHAQLIAEGKPMSGRCGGYVYYWAYGRLCWHLYVVPKDPRTAAQRRSRAAFSAASRAWSKNESLTEEQRDAWYAEAAKIKTRPRLAQSGPLTAQQHFVGRNSLKERWGLPLLLEPPEGKRKKAVHPPQCCYGGREGRTQNTEFSAQVQRPQWLVRPTWETRRACAAPAPSLPSPARAYAQEAIGRLAHSQLPFPQRLTRPSSERLQTASRPLPVQCRWQARSHSRIGSIRVPRWSSTLAQVRRSARFRELWRGG